MLSLSRQRHGNNLGTHSLLPIDELTISQELECVNKRKIVPARRSTITCEPSVSPCERSRERWDWANGYKPKTVAARLGEITFDIPQVRESNFYPQALEKGLRSERVLKLALAD
ncbi:MAG: transposase, partial [Chloroflexota bacterium]